MPQFQRCGVALTHRRFLQRMHRMTKNVTISIGKMDDVAARSSLRREAKDRNRALRSSLVDCHTRPVLITARLPEHQALTRSLQVCQRWFKERTDGYYPVEAVSQWCQWLCIHRVACMVQRSSLKGNNLVVTISTCRMYFSEIFREMFNSLSTRSQDGFNPKRRISP